MANLEKKEVEIWPTMRFVRSKNISHMTEYINLFNFLANVTTPHS